jgi:hypothetical protein
MVERGHEEGKLETMTSKIIGVSYSRGDLVHMGISDPTFF